MKLAWGANGNEEFVSGFLEAVLDYPDLKGTFEYTYKTALNANPNLLTIKYRGNGTIEWITSFDPANKIAAVSSALDSQPMLNIVGVQWELVLTTYVFHPVVVRYDEL